MLYFKLYCSILSRNTSYLWNVTTIISKMRSSDILYYLNPYSFKLLRASNMASIAAFLRFVPRL